MADQQTSPSTTLRTLKQAHEAVFSDQNIVGHEVIAKSGEKIGKVDALFVDNEQEKVRFMRVEAGGHLGFGERKWLIPIDAITSVDEHQVHVDQSHHKIIGAPIYDPEVISAASKDDSGDYLGGLYGYYGYGPYWGSGYVYPYWD